MEILNKIIEDCNLYKTLKIHHRLQKLPSSRRKPPWLSGFPGPGPGPWPRSGRSGTGEQSQRQTLFHFSYFTRT